ncbi:unnamed protein product, partial [Ceratitis capitata]
DDDKSTHWEALPAMHNQQDCQHIRGGDENQCKTISESLQQKIFVIFKLRDDENDDNNLTSKLAALKSRRGIDEGFNGASLFLAAIKVVKYELSRLHLL